MLAQKQRLEMEDLDEASAGSGGGSGVTPAPAATMYPTVATSGTPLMGYRLSLPDAVIEVQLPLPESLAQQLRNTGEVDLSGFDVERFLKTFG